MPFYELDFQGCFLYNEPSYKAARELPRFPAKNNSRADPFRTGRKAGRTS